MSPSAVPPFPDEGRTSGARKLALATRVDHLRGLPLFANCSKRQLKDIARSARLVQLETDQVLFVEDDVADDAGIVIAGHFVVRRRGRKVAEIGPGEIVGELGLLLGRPRSATVTTTSPSELLMLDRTDLRRAMDEVPGLGWNVLQAALGRMAENGARLGHV